MGIERGWRACAAVLAITCAGLAAGPASAQVAPAGSLDQARSGHTATLLASGKVLVVGGSGGSGRLASAEVYDPATNTWESAGSMATARSGHSATLLTSGRVLVVGGSGGMAGAAVASAEIYNPATNSWSQAVDDLAAARSGHTATLLPSGEVLVAGGSGTSSALASAEIYDPGTNAWRSTASLPVVRFWHSAVALATGEVLVFGGVSSGTPVFEANSYPPVNDAWPAAGILTHGRYYHAATLLGTGKVLVIGGQGGSGLLGAAEQYDPVTRSWSPTGSLVTPRYSHTATTLGSGKVLVTGGYSAAQEASMELYDPITGVSSLVGSMATTREEHTATLLASGKVLVVGGIGPGANRLASAELVAFPGVAVAPSALEFPAVVLGADAAVSNVTVTSAGDTPLNVAAVRLTGRNPEQFAIAADGCTGSRVAPRQSCVVSVRFAPTVAGSLAASLVVSSDAATGDQTVELAGTATDAPPPPSTVALDRAAFRVTWRKGVPSGSIQVAGTTGGAASLTFTLRRVTASGTRPVKGWTFQQAGAGPFARALALPKTLLPGTFRLDVTGSSPGGTVPRVSRDLKLKGPPEGIVKDAFASSTKAGAAATRLPGRRTEVWATFVFSALPTRGRITVAWTYPGHRRVPPLGQRVGKPRRAIVTTGLTGPSTGLPPGRYTAMLFVGDVQMRRVSVRIG